MRRKWAIVVSAGLVVLAVTGPYVFWHPARLNHEGLGQIKRGMTQAEMEELLGGPPGRYYPASRSGGCSSSTEGIRFEGIAEATQQLWYDDATRYEVWFDPRGLVAAKHKRIRWEHSSYPIRHVGLIATLFE